MNKRLILGVALGAGAVILSLIGRDRLEARSGHSAKLTEPNPHQAGPSGRPRPDVGPIDALDYQIQDRLHNSSGFGGGRILVTPEHRISFPTEPFWAPERQTEIDEDRAIVANLERQGWTVALYLAGRALLRPPMSESEWNEASEREGLGGRRSKYSPTRTISPPIMISGRATRDDLPKPRELWSIGRQALESARTSDLFESSSDSWSVAVRPVRADRQKCLNCHNSDVEPDRKSLTAHQKARLQIGDALGVAIYVYARTPPAATTGPPAGNQQ